jgi:hypothetical protein
MAQFYIKRKEEKVDQQSLDKVFENMQLKTSFDFESEHFFIRYYSPVNLEKPLFYADKDGNTIICTGTFLYKEENFNGSIKTYLQDVKGDRVEADKITGHYIIVMILSGRVIIHNDALGCFRVFSNNKNSVISSSFLACWMSALSPLKVNRNALIEKVATGFITAPETLVEEISDITYISMVQEGFLKKLPFAVEFKTGNKSVGELSEDLDKYMDRIFKAASGKTISLGVSGGFDSRLLLSLISSFPDKYLFTHCTKGVHGKEKSIAEKLVKIEGKELHCIETEHAEKLHTIEAAGLLQDLVYYYDGRTANNSGAFSMTGTFDYNRQHLDHAFIGLNGKGGEVLRNYYQLPAKNLDFPSFFRDSVCYASLDSVFSASDIEKLISRVSGKISGRIGMSSNILQPVTVKRYYSEIRQPDCEGTILSAHNKIGYYLAPFLDRNLLKSAYCSLQSQDHGVDYQSKLINFRSPALAKVVSKYGFAFTGLPLKQRLKQLLIRTTPLSIRIKRKQHEFNKLKAKGAAASDQWIGNLQEAFPDINWKDTLHHYAQRNVVNYLGFLFRETEGKWKS